MFKLTVGASEALAERIVAALEEGPEPLPVATGHFRHGDSEDWWVEALYDAEPDAAALNARLRALGPDPATPLAPVVAPLEQRDWVAESQRALAPVRAGRFFVHGGHDKGKAPPGAVAIHIDAGQAFGTGHHDTTTGCLVAFDRAARTRRFTDVLDLGCGTAVLAIAAARLLHARVTATDIDPVAVQVARANAAANGALKDMRLAVADGLSHRVFAETGPYDLIFANILAGPLMAMATALTRQAAPGGVIILSGLLERQAAPVAARYRAAGCRLRERLVKNGWATLTLAAPGP